MLVDCHCLRLFGCRLIAYDPYWERREARALGIELIDSLDGLKIESDVVSLHTAGPTREEQRRKSLSRGRGDLMGQWLLSEVTYEQYEVVA